jgi:hypothetical protein
MKTRIAEHRLAAQLDAGAHGGYRRRVPMLVPLGPG